MRDFLIRRWFLVSLLIVIPLGLRIGTQASPERVESFPKHYVEWASGGLTALVLFLMSVTLENRKLLQSFRAPGPVIWGTFVCFVLMPLGAIALLPLQRIEDFAVGLLIAAAVPSTMAAASVWARKAGGNDAVTLLITILTNGGCFLVTPLWLKYGLGDTVSLDTAEMIRKLFLTALVPIALGQLCRAWPFFREVADRRKAGFGGLAQICILAIVFWASIQGGVRLQNGNGQSGQLTLLPVIVVWISSIALHLAGMAVALGGGRAFGFSREDIVAAGFSASQKTLPIGIFLAAGLAETLPFAALPILLFHASQLILDTIMIDPLHRWVQAAPTPTPATAEA